MERILIDYLTNATWQIPLLAGGAWLFIRIGKFGPRTQHCIWLAVLALAVGLPFRGVRAKLPPVAQTTSTDHSTDASSIAEREALPRAAILTQFVVADPRLPQEFFALPRPTLRLSPMATNWLVGIYFAVLLFGLYRIAASWRRARQLVMDADLAVLPPQWNAIFRKSGRCLGTGLPQLRKSADVRSPVIVGVVHPVLLLPEDFDNHSQNEVQAALLHELAHVRRQDYLGNLLCRLAALPVAWHPLTYAVQQRIRRTREMVCDDIAARAMQSEIGYAKCLLAMAGRTLRQHDLADAAQAIGLFGDNVLEERIMRLMREKNTMTIEVKLARVASGAITMIIAIAIAVSFHVTPTLAQATGTAVTAPAPSAPPPTPAQDMIVAPLPPAVPASDKSAAPATPAPPVPPAPDTAEAPIPPPAPVAPVALAQPAPLVPQVAPVAPVAPVEPVPPVAPAPAKANPTSRHDKAIHPHPAKAKDESFVIDSNGDHALTREQQAQLKQEMDAMNRQIADATKRFNSPEFKQQMADIAKQQADLRHLDFAKMQRQIDTASAKINSPEFKQRMKNIQKQIESGAMQRSMEEASKQMKLAEQQQSAIQKLDMARMQQQIDAATAKINSPEFKQRMENIQKQIESGAMQRSMEEASKQLKAAEDRIRQEQTK
jgi:beta-lactamase regulating signal transducer with metallopeptidase domain